VVMTNTSQWVENSSDRMIAYSTVFPLCNICTVNYIMLGLQNAIVAFCEDPADVTTLPVDRAWNRLLIEFGVENQVYALKSMYHSRITPQINQITPDLQVGSSAEKGFITGWEVPCMLKLGSILKYVFQFGFKPFGIAAGSEKQGGLHETGLAPVQAAASHYTTLTVDGQNRDLVNIWQAVDVQAGDNLILRCDFVESTMMSNMIYVLNHYYKERQTREMAIFRLGGRWQVIPDVLKQSYDPTYVFDSNQTAYAFARRILSPNNVEAALNRDNVAEQVIVLHGQDVQDRAAFENYVRVRLGLIAPTLLDYRETGYWRIAQSFTKHKGGMWNAEIVPIDDMQYTKGHLLLQVTFAPVFKCHSLDKCVGLQNSGADYSAGQWCAKKIHAFCRMTRLRRFFSAGGIDFIPRSLMTGQKRTLDAGDVLKSNMSTVEPNAEPMKSTLTTTDSAASEVETKKAPTKKTRKEPLLKSTQPLNVTYGELSENAAESNKDK
jgi:hypothetical protein